MTSNSKLKIVYIAHQTANHSNGGLESATQIFESLSSDYDWTFITNRKSRFSERWHSKSAKVKIVKWNNASSLWLSLITSLPVLPRLRNIFKDTDPDIIHFNDIKSGLIVSLIPGLKHIPAVFTIRDLKSDKDTYGHHWRYVINRCSRIIALSVEMASSLISRLGLSPGTCIPIKSIVDLKSMSPPTTTIKCNLRLSKNIQPEEIAIGCIGALMKKKQQHELIKAAEQYLFPNTPEARLHFLGDSDPHTNSYAEKCRALAAASKYPENYVFHGHIDNISEWYKSLDVLIIASGREGLARGMIEAMASGLPVVSFDVCSAKEMLEMTGAGIVCKQGDYEGLITSAVKICKDEQTATRMGAIGRQTAKMEFSEQVISRQYRKLYADLIQTRKNANVQTA